MPNMTTVQSFFSDWMQHPDYWFHPEKKYDTYITETYRSLLETLVWDCTNTDVYYHLGCLILYDQVPRHMYREIEDETKIASYLQKSLRVYKYIQKYLCTYSFTAQEWCFYCLPVRHSKEMDAIIYVVHDTWKRLKKEQKEEERKAYTRFLKATYQRMPLTSQKKYMECFQAYGKSDFAELGRYFHILHYCPVSVPTIDPTRYDVYHAMETFVVSNRIKRILLSLSGGVDSMVCGYLLKKLQSKWQFDLTAVHINYNNRTIEEYDFVKEWCSYMQIPLYTRHITEIQRAPCMEYGLRNTYETYTKEVRFQTYHDVWSYYLTYPDFPKVLLGHNQDDCLENILTNVLHKSKHENLQGMYSQQVIDNIIFYRPLLHIPKKDIYHFAHQAGIPYLQDSTPSWSQRGKIRDKVRPAIEEWSPEMILSLFELAHRMTEYESIVKDVVQDMVYTTVQKGTSTWELHLPYRETLFSTILWGTYFRNRNIVVSHRALKHFLSQFEKGLRDRLCQEPGGPFSQITLNKNTYVRYRFMKERMVYLELHTEA